MELCPVLAPGIPCSITCLYKPGTGLCFPGHLSCFAAHARCPRGCVGNLGADLMPGPAIVIHKLRVLRPNSPQVCLGR